MSDPSLVNGERKSSSSFQTSSEGLTERGQRAFLFVLSTFTISTSISKSTSSSSTPLLKTTSSALCREYFLSGSGGAIMEPWPAPNSPLHASSTYRHKLQKGQQNYNTKCHKYLQFNNVATNPFYTNGMLLVLLCTAYLKKANSVKLLASY